MCGNQDRLVRHRALSGTEQVPHVDRRIGRTGVEDGQEHLELGVAAGRPLREVPGVRLPLGAERRPSGTVHLRLDDAVVERVCYVDVAGSRVERDPPWEVELARPVTKRTVGRPARTVHLGGDDPVVTLIGDVDELCGRVVVHAARDLELLRAAPVRAKRYPACAVPLGADYPAVARVRHEQRLGSVVVLNAAGSEELFCAPPYGAQRAPATAVHVP